MLHINYVFMYFPYSLSSKKTQIFTRAASAFSAQTLWQPTNQPSEKEVEKEKKHTSQKSIPCKKTFLFIKKALGLYTSRFGWKAGFYFFPDTHGNPSPGLISYGVTRARARAFFFLGEGEEEEKKKTCCDERT